MYIKPPLYCRCRFRGSKRKHVTVACKYLEIKLWNKFDLFSKEERATAKSVGNVETQCLMSERSFFAYQYRASFSPKA